MLLEVYCDEHRPELLYRPRAGEGPYALIGGVWLPADSRTEFKARWGELKQKYKHHEELKWRKVSRDSLACYQAAVDLFLEYEESIRFRCIAIDTHRLDLDAYHDGDAELGFYKFYYWLLDAWTVGPDEYDVFVDVKTTRISGRLPVLKRCLNRSAAALTPVRRIQAISSHESAGLQLADTLLGASGARFNGTLRAGSAKADLVEYLERRLGIPRIAPTPKSETKFNVFGIWLS